MHWALTNAVAASALIVALATPRALHAEARPIVRIVLLSGGESPAWFDGFVEQLENELALRGIGIAVTRSATEAGRRAGDGGAVPDAELVVDAPSAQRPVLRFSVTRDPAVTSHPAPSAPVREVNLAGVPSDGRALALAVAADELMRSNWQRAVPTPPASTERAGDEVGETPSASAPSDVKRQAGAASRAAITAQSANGAITAKVANGANAASRRAPSVAAGERSANPGRERGETDANDSDTAASQSPRTLALGVAAAGETFTGGQTQLGPDLRVGLRILPRLEFELRGGFRTMLGRESTNGAVSGTVLVAGGGLKVPVLRSARAALSIAGRADLLHADYRGEARNAAIAATTGSALGFVVAAGPTGSIALTRALHLEAELLAGASPIATTATDAWNAVVSTSGAAFLASLGLLLDL